MPQRGLQILGVVAVLAAIAPAPAVAVLADSSEAVLVLHGLARDSASMDVLAKRIEGAGYEVSNVDYPSTRGTPEELVRIVRTAYARCCTEATRVHFVTHSLGGILTRMFIDQSRPANLGRVVMIAPPNRGSEIVDLLSGVGLFSRLFGPTALALRTDSSGLTQKLPPVDYEVGVIAGDWPVNPLGAAVIPGRDDGGVSVEGTKLEGMADFLTVHRSHGRIAGAPEVGRQTLRFLRTGRFDHPLAEGSPAQDGPSEAPRR